MQPRERILTLLNGSMPDKLPFFHTDHHLLRGETERVARNRGLGVIVYRPCHVEFTPNVEVTTRHQSNSLIRTYKTPVGSLSEVVSIGIGYGMAGYAFRDWRGVIPATSEFLVKSPDDYRALKFIVEDIHYEPYYYAIEDQLKHLGEDGIVVTDTRALVHVSCSYNSAPLHRARHPERRAFVQMRGQHLHPTGRPALVTPQGTVTPQIPARLAVTV